MAPKVVVDTNIFINVKNREKPHYQHSKTVLDRIDEGTLKGVIPTVVVAEICSGYHATGELKEKDEFLTHILTSPNYRVVDVTVSIADEAGRIRATTGLRLPDALIIAAGLREKADYIVTYDETFRKAESLIPVVSPKEMVDRLKG